MDVAGVRRLGQGLTGGVHAFGGVAGERAIAATADDVARTLGEQQTNDRIAGSADAGDDDTHVFDLLVHDLQRVDERGEDDDRGAVLVVVEDGDVELGAQALFDLEAAGRGDVLQVDATVGGGDGLDDRDDLFGVLGVQDDRPRIHAAELLEQDSLALHDGQGGLGADIAQAQHSGAVGDDRNRVGLHGQQVGLLGHVVDGGAHAGHAGRVGAREVVAVTQRHLGVDFHLAADVAHEGLVGDRVGGHAGQRVNGVANLAAVLRIAHVARQVDDDAPAVGVGHVEALDLRSSRRDCVNNGRDGSRLLVHLDTVGGGVRRRCAHVCPFVGRPATGGPAVLKRSS